MHPLDKLWLLPAFWFSVYSPFCCCTLYFHLHFMMPQPVALDAVIHCYAVTFYEANDILNAITEEVGRLIPCSKSNSVSKLFFGFIRNVKGVFILSSVSSLSLVIHLRTPSYLQFLRSLFALSFSSEGFTCYLVSVYSYTCIRRYCLFWKAQ